MSCKDLVLGGCLSNKHRIEGDFVAISRRIAREHGLILRTMDIHITRKGEKHRDSGNFFSGSNRNTPFSRNHRRTWYIGAEFHTDGLNLDDQRQIHVQH